MTAAEKRAAIERALTAAAAHIRAARGSIQGAMFIMTDKQAMDLATDGDRLLEVHDSLRRYVNKK